MLAYERFLRDKKTTIDFPVPHEKGFIVYQTTINKINSINFLFFSVESIRNSLSTYNFRFTKVEMKQSNDINEIISNNVEVDWEKFFSSMKELKDKIKACDKYNIAETIDEADYLIWKSFVVINDAWFSMHYSKMPSCFLESLNEMETFEYRHKNKKQFIAILKENFCDIHYSWSKYFQRDYCDYFCSWFYHYFQNPE